tara:strand:+ start:2285 stop:3022 length:738 start_codon:yes stop_codon:yes gene_type:complete
MVVLENTSLAAIVRDEVVNPAGGILDFLKCVVPFVERAVVVDTGSVDGTRDLLEDAKKDYLNLEVYDHSFKGFADARNFSLSKVETDWAFVLDADERVIEKGFVWLAEEVFQRDYLGFNFEMLNVYPAEEEPSRRRGIHNPRLFRMEAEPVYKDFDRRNEKLYCKRNGPFASSVFGYGSKLMRAEHKLLHFLPEKYKVDLKRKDWYHGVVMKGLDKSPSEVKSSESWKGFNHRRIGYSGLPAFVA